MPSWRRWSVRRKIAVALLVCVSGALAATAVSYWRFLAHRAGRGSVALSWPASLGAGEAAELLADVGLTGSARWLTLYFTVAGARHCFVPGPHLLGPATPKELAAMLCRGSGRNTAKVTLPEGVNRFTVADRLAAAGVVAREAFLRASADRALLGSLGIDRPALADAAVASAADSAEGFLFPATYQLHLDSDPAELVRVLVREADRRFRQVADKHPQGAGALAAMALSRRQIVALASMVEKEAAAAEERPIIASVFLNRLRDPELPRLQSDPTAVYGCYAMPERIPACRGFDGKATPEINRDPQNAFSTYVISGLPPGPIANPGDASLEAVLAPADTRFRYFVAKGGGRHTFSETYAEHLEAVRQLREARP